MATIPIQFQYEDHQPVPSKFPMNCTFSNFETILKGIYGDDYWRYSFVCHGKSFDVDNEDNLAQMKPLLVPKTTVFTHVRTKGAGSIFADVTQVKSMKRIEFSKAAPPWRVAWPGLCLEGVCKNGKCEAHEQMVIANLGITEFSLNTEKKKFSKCPRCQEYFKPVTCAFNRCEWKYHGQIENDDDDEPKEVATDWTKADHAYHRFDDDPTNTLSWLELIFEVRSTVKS